MDTELPNNLHSLSAEDAFLKLDSGKSGLSENEAAKRFKIFGPNSIQIKTSDTFFKILLRQLQNPFVYMLMGSAMFSLWFGKLTDSSVIFGVVALNTLIGFFQEYKAHKTIKALTSLVPHQTTVRRDGKIKNIHSSKLVIGDVVVLQPGDRISADIRLFSIKNLMCDESTLTGESLPSSKRIEASDPEALPDERKCIAFNGTFVTSGSGEGIVISTGLKTEFGKIAELMETISPLETPLSITIKKLAEAIAWCVALISFGLFLIGYFRGISLFDAGFAAVTLAVAAIPEGLPSIFTIASSIGVQAMARKQAIIRQLTAVESLGSTTVICTDKTGTLTYNEMTVQKIWTKSGFAFFTGVGYGLEGKLIPSENLNNDEVIDLLKVSILCSDAILDENSNGLVPLGDPTEIALVVAGRKMGLNENFLKHEWGRLDVIPFESERRLMATLNATPDQKSIIFIKGAPEAVIEICESNFDRELIMSQISSMAKDGMRVLAIAKKEPQKFVSMINESDIKEGCILLGLIGMIDPPRKEVYQAIKSCHEAGIQVKMITGDHPLTAEAIGRDLGIMGGGKVLAGIEINRLSEQEWENSAKSVQIFARVLPEFKHKLVKVLQGQGHVVAVTGDGVNDAAALKQADIGIAMGIKGTAIAKEASDMILADDNFANIEAAVEEGRRVYDNLIKSLIFVLPTSLGLALVILIAILFFPIDNAEVLHPMSPVQILWVNLVIAVSLSLPLALEKSEPGIMKRLPRKKNAPILTRFLIIKTLVLSFFMAAITIGFFLWKYKSETRAGVVSDLAIAEAQTLAVTTMILFQVFYLFNCRFLGSSGGRKNFFSNPSIFIGVAFVLLAQIAFIYMPFMNQLFHASSLPMESLFISALVTCLIFPLDIFIRARLPN